MSPDLQARLEALVCSRDPDLVRQGCELLVSLDDPALLERLAGGCVLTDDGRLQLSATLFGRILPDARALIGLQLALSLASLAGRRPRRLRLPYDRLGDDGAALIACAPELAALEQLDLRGCGIRDPGAEALATSAPLRGLRALDLSDNPIEQKGALALAAARLPLERLHMTRNRFGQLGWRALRDAYGAALA